MIYDSAPIYLDNNGTTRVDPAVVEAILPFLSTHFGNPSSSHYYGRNAKVPLEHARTQVAEMIGANAQDIIFMSNGTETINHGLNGLLDLAKAKFGDDLGITPHLITQKSEHVAVLAT